MNYLSPLTSAFADRAVDRCALSNEGVGGLISSGLFALTDRPSSKVRTAIVRTSPTTLILVAASEAGYHGELQQVELQLTREPRPLPRLRLNPEITRLEDFRYEDFELFDYDPHPHIAGKVSV